MADVGQIFRRVMRVRYHMNIRTMAARSGLSTSTLNDLFKKKLPIEITPETHRKFAVGVGLTEAELGRVIGEVNREIEDESNQITLELTSAIKYGLLDLANREKKSMESVAVALLADSLHQKELAARNHEKKSQRDAFPTRPPSEARKKKTA
jgi:hypothetical protein